jgi:hypothetical protein
LRHKEWDIMDYVDTIKRGWRHTWNNKWLWVLGFLAALGSGGGSTYNTSNFQFGSEDFGPGTITPELGMALAGGALVLVCVFFIIGILLWLVSLAARGGLITSVVELERGETSSFGKAFRQGWRKVLPLAGMTILLFAVIIILVIVIAVVFAGTIVGAIAAGSSGSDSGQGMAAILGSLGIGLLCLLCLLIPLSLILSLIYPFAYRGMMLRDMGVMDAIRHGWRVLRDNVAHILVLGFIFFIVNLVIGAIGGAILGLLGLSTGLLPTLFSGAQPTTSQMVAGGLGLLAIIIVFSLISAVVTAWRSSTFTLAYQQWTGKEPLKDSAAPLAPTPLS